MSVIRRMIDVLESIDHQYDPEEIKATAQRMIERYSGLSYPPNERAWDHAFSYDRDMPQHAYWKAVATEIERIQAEHELARKNN